MESRPESERSRPNWVRRLLILAVLVVAAATVLAVPICQVYRGE